MTGHLAAPFFEIGPKNLLRRPEIESVVRAAGKAGTEHGVAVVVTVPVALVAPIADLRTGVLVHAQSMDLDGLGPSFGSVTGEALVDAGADGVMLGHDARPLDPQTLAATVARAREVGLETVVCVDSTARAVEVAAELTPTAVLLEPSDLIGRTGPAERDWIPGATRDIVAAGPGVLAMHAGGVATPEIAEAVMALGAHGTGSTSGVLADPDPARAAAAFIAATRAGWDRARSTAAARD